MRRLIATLVLAVAAATGLSACIGSPAQTAPISAGADAPGDDGQSTAQACALVEQTIDDAATGFESAASADPAAVVDGMRAAADTLSDVAPQVTNDRVAALLPSLQDMFVQVSDVMAAIVQGDVTKAGDLSGLGARFQETSRQFQELCAG